MKVLLLDGQPVVHAALRKALTQRLEVTVFPSEDRESAEAQMREHDCELIISDVRLGNADGFGVLERLRSNFAGVHVVVYTANDSPTAVARSEAFGALDFVSKAEPVGRLEQSIRCIQMGEPTPSNIRLERIRSLLMVREDERLPAEFPITPREAQVLRHLGLGLSNREIASSLSISVETVKEHVQNILRKVGANDRTDAAVRAVRAGLVDMITLEESLSTFE